MGLKITVVGGGSTYTPELVDGIARRSTRLQVDELALLDINRDRREIVGGLAGRMLRRGGWEGRLTITRPSTAPTTFWYSCASAANRRDCRTRRCPTASG